MAIFCRLQNYIQELRNCSTLEAEKERVDKELGKIRKKYTSDKALSGASQNEPCAIITMKMRLNLFVMNLKINLLAMPGSAAYDKRKYMWKLLYTRMLGYDVEFGQKQAMDLIAASG